MGLVLGMVLPPLMGQSALIPPAPLVTLALGGEAGAGVVSVVAAQRAQDLGLPGVAAELWRQERERPGADRAGLTLSLATALLDAGRPEEAEKALEEVVAPRGAAWHLRVGLAAAQLRRLETARREAAMIREADLPAEDLPWHWFLQGQLADLAQARDVARANEFYRRAEEAAKTELARARFQLARERLRLRLGVPRPEDIKTLRETYERNAGTQIGYSYAETHAVALDASGQKGQAVTFLQGVLVGLPRQERLWWDRLRLVLGMVGDRTRNGAGRNALSQLLESGSDPARQRQALQILAAESGGELERRHFRDLLGRLIGAPSDHPIKEGLLFFRAQLALTEKDFAQAEEDAHALLKQFTLSPLRAHALGVLTQSAWEQRRFRLAADYAQKTRTELRVVAGVAAAVSESRGLQVDLGILEAEAWFRAGLAEGGRGDFRSAADAYATVLRERPADLKDERLGTLMLQRVLAEIHAGSKEAGAILDELGKDPAFDLENRWRAEWSLARALQTQGGDGVREAYARVSRLLERQEAVDLRPELRVRMAWLQARLSFEGGEPARTVELANRLLGGPLDVAAGLKTEVASTAALLKARAQFALGLEPAALETLRKLREEHPGRDAAASSFLIESEYYADQEKIDEARNRLIALTDSREYRGNEYVPYALYRLALLAERLGRPENLLEANKRIEELVALVSGAAAGAQADLIFTARLRQGNIQRKLNNFPAAQLAYEDLVNRYPRRPDVVLALLALAECHNAQSSTDTKEAPVHADSAQRIFEQLRDRVDAPRDVRVEAGYNLGLLLARRGRPEAAIAVWGRDVVEPFLEKAAEPFEPDAKRPYWLARTLCDLGELLEKAGRLDEAKKAYGLLLEKKLPHGEALARTRLEKLGVPVAPGAK